MPSNFVSKVLYVVAFIVPVFVTATVPLVQGCGGGGSSKVCDVGKACGESCIAVNETCHK